MIAQPAPTFKLDSSLVFTLSTTPPTAGNYPGTTVPIGTVKAGSTTLNLYAGTPRIGELRLLHVQERALYTLVKSGSTYVAVQKSYTVYAATPAADQQQLAVFDLAGTTYMVTDGTTPGVGPAAGINPGTMWAQTATSSAVAQRNAVRLGLRVRSAADQRLAVGQGRVPVPDYRLEQAHHAVRHPLHVGRQHQRRDGGCAGAAAHIHADRHLRVLTPSYPLTFETGGYNAFTTYVTETATPSESFSGAYKTPVISTDPQDRHADHAARRFQPGVLALDCRSRV